MLLNAEECCSLERQLWAVSNKATRLSTFLTEKLYSSSPSEEIPFILRQQKVHHRVHKNTNTLAYPKPDESNCMFFYIFSLKMALWSYISVRLLIILWDLCGLGQSLCHASEFFPRGHLLAPKNNHGSSHCFSRKHRITYLLTYLLHGAVSFLRS